VAYTEHIQEAPKGWKVRVLETESGHQVKVAFPRGPRRRGSGRLISIVHPHGRRNPCRGHNPAKLTCFEIWKHSAGGPELVGLERDKKKAQARARDLRGHTNLKVSVERFKPQPNPAPESAEDTFRKFHGKDPSEILKVQISNKERKKLPVIGPLEDMKIEDVEGRGKRLRFHGDQVLACAAPGGRQIYFIGGNQELSTDLLKSFGADPTKDQPALGEVIAFCYWAAKKESGWKVVPWEHALGEDSGKRPTAYYDKLKKRVFWVGGNYRIEPNWVMD
jgi:hypothetical protein